MTPYQLSRYYASTSQITTPTQVSARSCIDVWDLQTGKLVYRLVPPLPPNTTASITDIQISPNTAHVFACVEIREYGSRKNHLCCWDFSNDQLPPPSVKILPPLSSASSFGHAWACYY
jgi:WD40 repeat protein